MFVKPISNNTHLYLYNCIDILLYNALFQDNFVY